MGLCYNIFFFANRKGLQLTNSIIINDEDGILDIQFNRPDRKNAINREMFEELLKALNDKLKNRSLRGVFLSGSGDSFSAGGDVKDMAANEEKLSLEEKTVSLRKLLNISKLLYSCSVPTVAVITGPAAGAGLALSLACDLRIANKNAKFTTAFSKVGFSGDFGAAYFLKQIVGNSKAKELFYFSDILCAEEAKSAGLINYIKDNESLKPFIEEMKEKIRKLPPLAIKYIKKNISNAEFCNLDHYLDEEALYQMICSETNDHKNAVKSFINKELPVFKGN